MAKVVVTEWDKTIHFTRHQIVCEDCGAPGPVGKQAIKRYEGRPWRCVQHSGWRRGAKARCICGHGKTAHSAGRNHCRVATGTFMNRKMRGWQTFSQIGWDDLKPDEVPTQENFDRRRRWTIGRPAAWARKLRGADWVACQCKHYRPNDEVAI